MINIPLIFYKNLDITLLQGWLCRLRMQGTVILIVTVVGVLATRGSPPPVCIHCAESIASRHEKNGREAHKPFGCFSV